MTKIGETQTVDRKTPQLRLMRWVVIGGSGSYDHEALRIEEEKAMAGFGSRGGLREMGVLRPDDPMQRPTATTPVWRSEPPAADRTPPDSSPAAANVDQSE
jgi:hypothetical protein